MMVAARRVVVVLTMLACAAAVTAAADENADKKQQIEQLIELHDLTTSVSIGNYYLKQESLVAIRSLLARLGKEENLGPDWNARNPQWRRAEETLLQPVMAKVADDFTNLGWLRPQWEDLDAREFSAEELDVLLTHFHSDVGRKQAKIVDHTVSTHVITTLSFSGKLKDIPGVQEERSRMQNIWNKEDDEMRFSIQDATNADGQRFAYSALGKKYFVTAILKLTGIISRRIEELALALPKEVDARADQVRPLLQEFKSGRG
ncbi:MAG TPA: hypothetical protein VKD04_11430 [Burkholderiales bacterium]|nr:hypothetical protein [Burkholderiales bacterium]